MEGWVKIHRKIMDYEWYKDTKTTMLLVHLILKANHKETQYRTEIIKRGQVYTGRKQLAYETGLSEQNIRTSLNHLKSTNILTIKSTKQYSVITLNNYDKYQTANQQPNQQLTNNQPTTNHIQEEQELKEHKKKYTPLDSKLIQYQSLGSLMTYVNKMKLETWTRRTLMSNLKAISPFNAFEAWELIETTPIQEDEVELTEQEIVKLWMKHYGHADDYNKAKGIEFMKEKPWK